MSKVYRVYVEKKSAYAIEANELLNNIQTQLKIETVTDVHVVNRYDLQGCLLYTSSWGSICEYCTWM